MKYKCIRQHDSNDCGAACLATVAAHYGIDISIQKARAVTRTDVFGTSLYSIAEGASSIGLFASTSKGSMVELLHAIEKEEISFPFIAHIIDRQRMEHFVVVHSIKSGNVIIADPAIGITEVKERYFDDIWTGYIVQIESSRTNKPERKRTLSGNIYLQFLRTQLWLLIAVSGLSAIIALTGVLTGFTLQVIVDGVLEYGRAKEVTGIGSIVYEIARIARELGIQDSRFNLISVVCGGMILIYIFQHLFSLLRGILFSTLCRRFNKIMVRKFFDHIIGMPYTSFQTQKAGDIINRYANVSEIREAIVSVLLTLGLDVALVLTCGIVLTIMSPTLCLLVFSIVIAFGLIALCYNRRLKKANEDAMISDACVMAFIKETVDGIETIKSTSSERWCKTRAKDLIQSLVNNNYREDILSISQGTVSGITMTAGLTGIVWVGAILVCKQDITLGTMLTFYSLIGYFFEPIKNILDLQPTIQKAVVAANRLNDILKSDMDESQNEDDESALCGDLIVRDMACRYYRGEPILENCNLTIKHGSIVGIVGKSGCGKTTLAKAIAGLLPLEEGEILLGDMGYRDISSAALRKKIMYVPQSPFFFADTIHENLTIGLEHIKNNEIEEACYNSDADGFIRETPFGYKTVLGENASNISMGQKQRLAIARALLHSPDIVIFDESTSNIDVETERVVLKRILDARRGMTTIFITHNNDLTDYFDTLFFMENGVIVEKPQGVD